ncbi:MAG: FdtA/QdtA family cupin domain-containing protein [Treponema sp.]|jgi:dTDP-4-dehydrorhamnose 3,5-epimerase-like enzyme|nr:FdtA/QdtA family cupin domain-containing protein [Treponema sp.]
MEKAGLIEFKINGDERGSLIAVEAEKQLPYKIARIFYMSGMNAGAVRGKHANKKSAISFIAVNGSCTIMVDDGSERESFILDKPNIALLCLPMTWKEMYDFSSDCILMGICDTYYDAGDYIPDYNAF